MTTKQQQQQKSNNNNNNQQMMMTSSTNSTTSNNSNSSSSNSLFMTLHPENEEAQNNEMMCLQSIYIDDFELLESDAVCKRFKVTLIPHPTNQFPNYCSVKLNIKYSPNYPETLPSIELEKVKGLSDDQIDELYILLNQKMVAGEVIVFELCQAIQEFLLLYNKETVSLHEEMIQRLKEMNCSNDDQFKGDNMINNDHNNNNDNNGDEGQNGNNGNQQNNNNNNNNGDEGQIDFKSSQQSVGMSSSTSSFPSLQGLGLGGSSDMLYSNNNNNNPHRQQGMMSTLHHSPSIGRMSDLSPMITSYSYDSFDPFIGGSGMMGGSNQHGLDNIDSIFEDNNNSNNVDFQDQDGDNSHDGSSQQIARIRYKLGARLSKANSSTGVVYECTNLDTNQPMICHQMTIDNDSTNQQDGGGSGTSGGSGSGTIRENMAKLYTIQKEVECMRYLVNPQLTRYIGTSLENNTLFVFQEYVANDTLRRCIEHAGNIEEHLVRKYTYQLLLALLYLHSQHIPHRDVQAKNIFIDEDTNRVLFTNYGGKGVRIFESSHHRQTNKNYWNQQQQQLQQQLQQQQQLMTSTKYLLRREDLLNLGLVVLEMLTGNLIPTSQRPSNCGNGTVTNEYLKIYENTKLPDTISPVAKDFLNLIFNSDINDKIKLEVGLLLKHQFISLTTSPNNNQINNQINQNQINNQNQNQISPIQQHKTIDELDLKQQTLPGFNNLIQNILTISNNSDTFSSSPPTSPRTMLISSNSTNTTTSTSSGLNLGQSFGGLKSNQQTNQTNQQLNQLNPLNLLNQSNNQLNNQTTPSNPPQLNDSPPTSNITTPTKKLLANQNSPSQSNLSQQNLFEFRYQSRYRTDFEEEEMIGKGGFGMVMKARNKLDMRYYAVKKIKTEAYTDNDYEPLTNKLLREVTTLSRLHHQYVVRYYQAWIEKSEEVVGRYGELEEMEDLSGDLETDISEDWFLQSSLGSRSMLQSYQDGNDQSVSQSFNDTNGGGGGETDDDYSASRSRIIDDESNYNNNQNQRDNQISYADDDSLSNARSRVLNHPTIKKPSTGTKQQPSPTNSKKNTHTLYIQMEYCSKKTLKTLIEGIGGLSEEEIWRLFRQMVEGLNHIHSQGIIHRDLKPANIFIDTDDNCKIGDFGLATTGGKISTNPTNGQNQLNVEKNSLTVDIKKMIKMMNEGGELDASMTMTGGVGTPFYCCPEILQKTTKHYSEKVDIYSLGIILFEMCHPLSTQMERSNVLRDLRSELKFPPGFEALKPDMAQLIRSMIQHDPNQRPTTKQLLESDLLPSRMEDELLKEAVKSITNPTLSLFGFLMEKLFGLAPDEHISSRYLYTSNATLASSHLRAREKTFLRLSTIFKYHGAIQIDTPLLFPKDAQSGAHGAVVARFLDEGGTVVQLPYDLTVPWARHVALHGITSCKRFSFSKVFRRAAPGFSPKELYECDFDIVGPSKIRNANDAELLRTVVDVMDEFARELGTSYIVKVSHYAVLDGVLYVCGVERRHHGAVCMAIATLHWRNSWSQVAQSLREIGVHSQTVNRLAVYLKQKSELIPGLAQLDELLVGRRDAIAGLSDLRNLARNLQAINIIPKFYLDLSLVHNYHYYDGVVFQVVNEKQGYDQKTEILMAGGRYDKLIRSFQPQASQPSVMGSVGVTIATEKIVTAVLLHEQRISKMRGVKSVSGDIEAFVCSLGAPMMTEKLQVSAQLWSMGIKTDYSHTDHSNLEEIYSHCRQNGIVWAIILKERTYQTGVLKVRHIDTRQESTISRKDLVDFILKSKKLYSNLNLSGGSGSGIGGGSSGSINLGSSGGSGSGIGGGIGLSGSGGAIDPQSLLSDSNQYDSPLSIQIIIQSGGQAIDEIKKKKIESNIKDLILKMFKGFYQAKGTSIKVIAVDLPISIVKEFVDNDNVTKYNKIYKDKLVQLKNQISKWKMIPFFIIYSYKDDKSHMISNV